MGYKNNRKKEARKKRRKAMRVSASKVPLSIYFSLAVGILSLISFFLVCAIAAANKGAAGIWVGTVPLIAGLANIFALIIAYKGFKMDDVRSKWVSVASIINGIMIILYLLLYIIGIG
ncbi:MAG: hypothetical protein E7265_10555 [Lachnospiraceae bacterium]|nr:hypothetical protein [Lachnospiraceae bacterium]